jgi:MFS family permease
VHLRRQFTSGRSTLWRNSDFLNLWSAETIAQFGVQLGIVAIPLIAAITLSASPLEMGVLAAAGQLPRLVVGFFAGAWVDRVRRRPIMIAMDIGRALTYAAIPVAAMLDLLSFPLLLAVALLAGAQSVFFDAAWSAVIPDLVERRDLADANGKLMGSVSLAQVTGPALAGTLIALLTGPMTMGITAATFAGSGYFLTRIRKVETRPEPDAETAPDLLREVREGFHELWRNRIVRPLTTSSTVINLGGFMFMSVYVLYMTDDLGLSEQGIGLVFAAGGIGALIASIAAAPLARRYGVGRTILWSAAVFGGANFLVPAAILAPAYALPLVVASETVAWFGLQVYNVNRFSLRQALTPNHLMGRVASSTMTIMGGAQLVGSLTGGLIGQVFSVHIALYVSVAVMFLAVWWVWDSPVPGIERMPEGPEVDVPEPHGTTAGVAAPGEAD